jgi:hypothetical protein
MSIQEECEFSLPFFAGFELVWQKLGKPSTLVRIIPIYRDCA